MSRIKLTTNKGTMYPVDLNHLTYSEAVEELNLLEQRTPHDTYEPGRQGKDVLCLNYPNGDFELYEIEETSSPKKLATQQILLQKKVQDLANVNIVSCGNCGQIILHEINDDDIECFNCGFILDQSDCPDLWFDGAERNYN